jgi:urease accessory protein UreF
MKVHLKFCKKTVPKNCASVVVSHLKLATVLESFCRKEEALKHATQAAIIRCHNGMDDRYKMRKYKYNLNEHLVSILSQEELKKIENEQ